MAMEAGYQALFTVYGQHMGFDAAADQLGRYAVESRHPEVFKMAVNFGNNDGVAPGGEAARLASAADGGQGDRATLELDVSIEDMALIRQRRRNANRLGFAVHLAYLRFPGRVPGPATTRPQKTVVRMVL
jgi:hypothetical protein